MGKTLLDVCFPLNATHIKGNIESHVDERRYSKYSCYLGFYRVGSSQQPLAHPIVWAISLPFTDTRGTVVWAKGPETASEMMPLAFILRVELSNKRQHARLNLNFKQAINNFLPYVPTYSYQKSTCLSEILIKLCILHFYLVPLAMLPTLISALGYVTR